MASVSVSLIVLACVFGGALVGMTLRAVLPEHHRSAESKDTVKLITGLIATMAALLLGLLVASAKSSYEEQKSELTNLAARVVFLDRVLAHYGPETQEIRQLLRTATSRAIDQIWAKGSADALSISPAAAGSDIIYDRIQQLSPKNDTQRAIQAQASNTAIEMGQTRWLMFTQRSGSISTALLVVVVLWLTVIFVSAGLFAPPNATVTASLFVCALSVSCAIFLILEMNRPFEGMLQISSAPLRNAIVHLGQ